MRNPDCRICRGLGWVCENHPDKEWSREFGCQCGAGMRCACQGTEIAIVEPGIADVIEPSPTPKLSG
nr:hypothetical protein FNV92_29325 [Bradyrhizobium cosmicum]